MALVSIDPADGRRIGSYRPFDRGAVEDTLALAHSSQFAWRQLAVSARARHLRNLARLLRRRAVPLAALAAAEMGKPVTQGLAEVEKCAQGCEFIARHGPRWLADESPPGAPRRARVVFDPLGVVLAIMPWNFPFWQVVRAAAPALLAGNTVLLKHASNVTGCAIAIEEAVRDAGLPAGVFQSLLLPSGAVARLVADPRVRAVTITGSTEAGRAVAAAAGAALKPVVCELGGSDAYVVLPDADLEAAAEACAQSRLQNSGQSCVCAKRFIVTAPVRREFERRLVARMEARRSAHPMDPDTDVGPLARGDLRLELHRQVAASIRRGARLLLGGVIPPGAGFFYPPTVLTGVRPGMPAHDEELFGPVAAVIPVRDERAAVAAANRSPFGLGAAVFTRNRRRARELARELEAGQVFVNDFVRSDPSLPFGGVKDSGFGRELGCWGVRSFVNVKTLWMA